MIRSATTADAAAIAAIYNHYVLNTSVTFEEDAVPANEMAQRITDTLEAELPWLVWEEHGRVLGYCYASKWKSRCAYRYSVETTVYLDPMSYEDLKRLARAQGRSALMICTRPIPVTRTSFSTRAAPPSTVRTDPPGA